VGHSNVLGLNMQNSFDHVWCKNGIEIAAHHLICSVAMKDQKEKWGNICFVYDSIVR
jgi:hypothetical protein